MFDKVHTSWPVERGRPGAPGTRPSRSPLPQRRQPMQLRPFLVTALLALGLASLVASPALAGSPFAPHGPVAELGRTCGAPEPTSFEMEAVASALRRYIEEGRAGATGQIK